MCISATTRLVDGLNGTAGSVALVGTYSRADFTMLSRLYKLSPY